MHKCLLWSLGLAWTCRKTLPRIYVHGKGVEVLPHWCFVLVDNNLEKCTYACKKLTNMPFGEERDALTGVYKTNDPIQNFKIRFVPLVFAPTTLLLVFAPTTLLHHIDYYQLLGLSLYSLWYSFIETSSRVHLRHVKAAYIPLPQFINDDQEDGASSASVTASVTVSGASQARGNSSDDEIRTFSWQEKVFSRYEVGW